MKGDSGDTHQLRKWIQRGGSILSGGLFLWLLSRQDWQRVLRNIAGLPGWVLPLALLLIFSGLVVNAWRWWVLLRSQNISISFGQTLKIIIAGSFASNFLPSTVGGDAFRVVSLFQLTENRVIAVSSVLLDRFLNVLAYTSLLPSAILVFGSPAEILSGAWISKQAAFTFVWRDLKFANLRQKFRQKVLQPLFRAIRMWSDRPLVLVEALFISWLSLIVVFCGVWILAVNIGIPVRFWEVMAVSVLVYLLTLLPISVNGYGVREVAVTTLYVKLGATLDQAATLALLTRFLSLLETLPGALWLSQVIVHPEKSDYPPAPEPSAPEVED